MIFINRQVNNHYSMVGTHFLQTGYLLLNRNAPSKCLSAIYFNKNKSSSILVKHQAICLLYMISIHNYTKLSSCILSNFCIILISCFRNILTLCSFIFTMSIITFFLRKPIFSHMMSNKPTSYCLRLPNADCKSS